MAKSRLIFTERDAACVVDFRDETVLDPKSVPAVTEDLYDLVDNRKFAKILLDLSAVRFLSSPMIGTLVALHKKTLDHGGQVVLCGLSGNLYRVFQVSRLTTVLRFAPSVEAGERFLHEPATEGAIAAQLLDPAPPTRWAAIVSRQVRIFFAGALVVAPLAITVWVVWSLGAWLEGLGMNLFRSLGITPPKHTYGIGGLIIIGLIYVVGLLTHLWLFRGAFGLVERLIARLPGIKTIYESVRDLMKLFGGDSQRMGRVVQYSVPGTDMSLLGILTNENPFGLPPDSPHRKVTIYVPYSYMFGGPTFFASPEHIVEVDMSVEQCMKTAATAMVGAQTILRQPAKKK
jgi:anti-anti-sigma factor